MTDVLVGAARCGGAADMSWDRARDAADHVTVHRTAPQQRILFHQISLVPRTRKPVLESWACIVQSVRTWPTFLIHMFGLSLKTILFLHRIQGMK